MQSRKSIVSFVFVIVTILVILYAGIFLNLFTSNSEIIESFRNVYRDKVKSNNEIENEEIRFYCDVYYLISGGEENPFVFDWVLNHLRIMEPYETNEPIEDMKRRNESIKDLIRRSLKMIGKTPTKEMLEDSKSKIQFAIGISERKFIKMIRNMDSVSILKKNMARIQGNYDLVLKDAISGFIHGTSEAMVILTSGVMGMAPLAKTYKMDKKTIEEKVSTVMERSMDEIGIISKEGNVLFFSDPYMDCYALGGASFSFITIPEDIENEVAISNISVGVHTHRDTKDIECVELTRSEFKSIGIFDSDEMSLENMLMHLSDSSK